MPSEIGPSFRGNWKAVITGSEFVSAAELDGAEPTLTIKDVRRAEMESMDAGGKTRSTLVVYFEEAKKGLALNRTNAVCLAALFGDNVSGWVGSRITLCAEQVQFGRERVLGIRVKGSPDIQRVVKAEIKMPRKRPQYRELVPTGNTTGNQPRRQSGPGNRQPQQEQADSPAEALARWASTQRGPFPWDDEGEALEQMDDTRAMYWLGKVGA